MASILKEGSSLETMLDFVVAARSGLLAKKKLVPLAKAWAPYKATLRKARDARDDARENRIECSAKERVTATDWRPALGEVSRYAFVAAKSDAGASPYSDLFGTIKSNEAQSYGFERATAYCPRRPRPHRRAACLV